MFEIGRDQLPALSGQTSCTAGYEVLGMHETLTRPRGTLRTCEETELPCCIYAKEKKRHCITQAPNRKSGHEFVNGFPTYNTDVLETASLLLQRQGPKGNHVKVHVCRISSGEVLFDIFKAELDMERC